MTNKQWHPDDLQQVFPEIPESCSRALMNTAGSLKEESEMKMRYTLRLVLAVVLVLICMMGIALAAFYPTITEFFGKHYGENFQTWLEEGDVAAPEDSIVVEGITFTLNEVAYRNRGLYGMGTITPGEGITLLSEDSMPGDAYGYAVHYGDKAPVGTPTILEKAAQDGSVLKQAAFYLETIGVDGGAQIAPDSWGGGVYPQRDGSIQFHFEAEDGQAISEGDTYIIVLTACVRNVSPEGEVDYDNPIYQEWTVEIEPKPYSEVVGIATDNTADENVADAAATTDEQAADQSAQEAASTDESVTDESVTDESVTNETVNDETVASIAAEYGLEPKADNANAASSLPHSASDEIEITVPEAYTQTGTLPVYTATERNFGDVIQYEWFNQSGVAEERMNGRGTGGSVTFSDEAQLSWSKEAVFYSTYDGTYEATSELADGTPSTQLLDKHTMASEANSLASWMLFGFPGTDEVYTLERTELTNITLEEAKAKAEAMLALLGMEGYTYTAGIDMGVERIEKMGNLLNQAIDNGNLSTNNYRYDYSTATVSDEGYHLQYHKYGTSGDLSGQFEAVFYVTADGIVQMSLREFYIQGDIHHTPDSLVDAETVIAALPGEMADSRFLEELKYVTRATLTWMPIRADKGDGMVMTPVWVLSYLSDNEQQQDYEGWAVFDAVTGKLLDAIFN